MNFGIQAELALWDGSGNLLIIMLA